MIIAVFWLGLLGAIGVALVVKRGGDQPLHKIGDAPDATLVRIGGAVVGEPTLRAPLSGRPCLYYVASVTVGQYNKRNTHRVANGAAFAITDETGTALVPREGAKYEVSHDVVEIERASRLKPRLVGAIERLGVVLPDIAEVTLYEGIIAPGDEIEIVGAGMRKPVADDTRERGFRDMPSSTFELHGEFVVRGARRPGRRLE
jgi:hypothetical protein